MRENAPAIMLALALACLLILVALVVTYSRLGRLTRHYRRLTRGATGENLQDVLEDFIVRVENVDGRVLALDRRLQLVEQEQLRSLRHVGLVRFDAFDDVGGEQSFALAVLDSRGGGFTLSSIFSRSDVRVYAKEIEGGRPTQRLSDEEQQAVTDAERG